MLLDAIATAILAGLMLIPIVNIVVGAVVGAGLVGPLGAIAGVLLAIGIAGLEIWLSDVLGWRDLRSGTATVSETFADEEIPTTEHTIRTGPPSPRRQPRPAQEAKPARRVVHAKKLQRGAVG